MRIVEVDPNCLAGWGPCTYGFGHACDRAAGHPGRHRCGQCDATTKDRPDLWPPPADGMDPIQRPDYVPTDVKRTARNDGDR